MGDEHEWTETQLIANIAAGEEKAMRAMTAASLRF